ncbi:hypothetical protein H6503_03840 [Candidatus Woesearchaeota archaeon]|nr:hypothetical protein [Candidatus Woesearchaeota archaeon]
MKPQLVVRLSPEHNGLYVASFNMSALENRPRHTYRRSADFRDYITHEFLKEELHLDAAVALGPRQISLTEGVDDCIKKNQALQIAHVHYGIFLQAKRVAEEQHIDYFGVIVTEERPREPVDADKDPYDISDTIKIGGDIYQTGREKPEKYVPSKIDEKPKPIVREWTLHPTVQLYVRR